MVILLIILAMVSIRGLTGKDGLLTSSSNVANEYVVEQYREQVNQLAHSIILKDSFMREENNNREYGRGYGRRGLD